MTRGEFVEQMDIIQATARWLSDVDNLDRRPATAQSVLQMFREITSEIMDATADGTVPSE